MACRHKPSEGLIYEERKYITGGGKKKEKMYTPRNLAQITECYESAAELLGFEEREPHTSIAVNKLKCMAHIHFCCTRQFL